MATEVIILGEQSEQKQEPKKIEFVKCLLSDYEWQALSKTSLQPIDFKNIELVCREYAGKGTYDIMFAYDDNRSAGSLYLGHFNDGVV